jgi:hypothetical protein
MSHMLLFFQEAPQQAQRTDSLQFLFGGACKHNRGTEAECRNMRFKKRRHLSLSLSLSLSLLRRKNWPKQKVHFRSTFEHSFHLSSFLSSGDGISDAYGGIGPFRPVLPYASAAPAVAPAPAPKGPATINPPIAPTVPPTTNGIQFQTISQACFTKNEINDLVNGVLFMVHLQALLLLTLLRLTLLRCALLLHRHSFQLRRNV